MGTRWEDRQKALTTALKSLPLFRPLLTLGAGVVSTLTGLWIIWIARGGVKVEASDAVLIAWINLLTVMGGAAMITNGIVVISIAFARLDKISINAPGGAGFAMELGDEPQEPTPPEPPPAVQVTVNNPPPPEK